MKVLSVNIHFGRHKKPYIPKGCHDVRSISTNAMIPTEEIWNDLDTYRKVLPNLSERALTREEMNVYALLPNVEIKRMYIDKILSILKK